jgi:hypothetical protein
MRRLLREPLLHFLIGGALLFVFYGIVADDVTYAPDRIVITEERVASLATTFQRTWLRPPTRNELDALIQGYVDEEVLYREGLALGLDRDDRVIRRRLRQKVEFLHTDLAQLEKATDAELATFLEENPQRFQEPARCSFRQVFVNPGKDEAEARRRADEILQKLRAGGSVEGDRTLLPEAMERARERDVAAVFGDGFAADVLALEGDGWTGPLASSFGLHLIRIDERAPARMPELGQIRQDVAREHRAVKSKEANQRFVQGLRDRYDIEIRMPPEMAK